MGLVWKIALGIGAAALLLYLAVLAALYWNQRSFIYPAPANHSAAATPAERGAIDVRIATEDGLDLRAIYRPAPPGRPTVIFFHGNGDSLAGSQEATRGIASAGYGVLLPEYRGYGGNRGSPSEEGLYRDGRAALRWLASQGVRPEQTVLIGNSLGSGVATEMALQRRVGGLILISGFTSLADVVGLHLPFVPARWLVKDRYDNLGKIPKVACPILILHGTSDTVIPVRLGKELAGAASVASLELIPDRGHELAYARESQARIVLWLRRTLP
ncbi:hypothetical protein BH09PSE4_BH09PSE4_06440 [soil metagenome]